MSSERRPDDTFTGEVLTPEELAELRRQLAEARDNPGEPQPAPTSGPPPTPQLPEPAVPGAPPPPLPGPEWSAAPQEPWEPPDLDEPVLEVDLGDLEPYRARLRARPEPPWSVASVLEVFGPARSSGDALIDEMSLELTALSLPEASLNPHPEVAPLLSRLRMLHTRLLPASLQAPLSASWEELAGGPAVLDRLAVAPDGRLTGFSLAAELSPDHGLVVLGSAPSSRAEALEQIALPLARLVALDKGGLRWPLPAGWRPRERLDITIDTARATVRLEPLWPDTDLERWRDELFGRAPFLRDLQMLEDRPIEVRGVGEARLQRFHWQPSGMGRLLTTVVVGRVGDAGFSFVIEVPFEPDGATPRVDVLALLATVEVLPEERSTTTQAPPHLTDPPPFQQASDRFGSARAAMDRGEVGEALRSVEDAMDGDPFPPLDVLSAAASMLPAVGAAADAVIRRPTDAAALRQLGLSLNQAGFVRSSVSVLRSAVAAAPDDHDVMEGLVQLTYALEQQERYRDAAEVLEEHHPTIEGSFPALYRLAHNWLLSGNLDGFHDAVERLPAPPDGDSVAEVMHLRLRQAVARAQVADSAPGILPLDDGDLRGWHFVVTGGILTGLAPPQHEGMNGRFALLYDSYATCHAGLFRLARVVLAWQEPPARILAFPDRDSRALALAAQRLLGGTVADYEGGADEALIIAYDLGAVDDELLRRLSLTATNQVVFAHVADWTHPPLTAPDVVTVLAQSMHRPWDAQMRVSFEPGQDRPTVVDVPPDPAGPDVLADRILAADPQDSSLDPGDHVEELSRFLGAVGLTPTGALQRGVRERFWPYDIVRSARFL